MPIFGRKRTIRNGDGYTVDDEDIDLEEVAPNPEIPVDIQGEPWGWTKGEPFPIDYGRKNPE